MHVLTWPHKLSYEEAALAALSPGVTSHQYLQRPPLCGKGLTVNVDSLFSTYLVIHFMMSYDDSTYLVIEIMTYDVSIKMKAKMCESLKKIVHCQYKSMNYHRN